MSKKLLIFSAFLILFSAKSFAQSGGTFEITQSAIASGGGQNAAGGTFSLDGTIGQSVAGNALRGNPFAVTSGFWNFTPAAPTAAGVVVSGHIKTSDGRGIRNARITLIAANGETQSTASGLFGYYHFDDVRVGATYVISVSAKRFVFGQPLIVCSVFEEIGNLDFVAEPFTDPVILPLN